jgi:thymidylate synthase (FAD)
MLFRQVRLISATPDAEQTIAYCARVSSPKQDNDEWAPLLAYCIRNHHWSIFEMANMVVEITTSRAIAQQILRHRSFSFQEFSQRYAAASDFYVYEARRQDSKNRQNSIDDLSQEDRLWFSTIQIDHGKTGFALYQEALERGIAKECARFLLPLSTETKLYMNGTLRSWIHYLQLRTTPGTQLEHLEIAEEIKIVFAEQFPAIAEALEW